MDLPTTSDGPYERLRQQFLEREARARADIPPALLSTREAINEALSDPWLGPQGRITFQWRHRRDLEAIQIAGTLACHLGGIQHEAFIGEISLDTYRDGIGLMVRRYRESLIQDLLHSYYLWVTEGEVPMHRLHADGFW